MPTPMKDSAASVKIASGMPKVIETTIQVSASGNTWRGITRQKPAGGVGGKGSAAGGVGDGAGCAPLGDQTRPPGAPVSVSRGK